MTKFLFWNVNRRNPLRHLARLVHKHEIDVLMLAECAADPGELLLTLSKGGDPRFHYSPKVACDKIEILTRFPSGLIAPVYETDKLTIRHLTLPGLTDVLLAITHFPSKLYWSESSQALECVDLSTEIKNTESRMGHQRTVLVGDLNMNPFEDGVVSAAGLHGVMTRRIAEGKARTVQSRRYPFFYNPMWGLLGDRTEGPAGTFFFRSAEQKVLFWNMFDQVLLRPNLLPFFESDSLVILESDGTTSFFSKSGVPNVRTSDHLPIMVSLNL